MSAFEGKADIALGSLAPKADMIHALYKYRLRDQDRLLTR
jgi:hypothetical protein